MIKTKLWLVAGLLAILTGCGQQPDLEIDADQNRTEQNGTEQNGTEQNGTEQNNTQIQLQQSGTQETNATVSGSPIETDLTDTTDIKVNEETNSTDIEEKINQNLANSLSKEVVHFDFDKYNIKSSQVPIVENVSNLIKDENSNLTVRIEGNCDEWGSDEYNYALGLKRAKVVKQALIDLGVDAKKLTIISYGESNPVCSAHNKECWAKNRRDDFTLLP
jgi:peptidoglycan-associated lipoprotein